MLLNRLAKYYGVRDNLTQKAVDNIHSFNVFIDQPGIQSDKFNLILNNIFKEVVDQSCDEKFINAITSAYMRKANWLRDSVWNTKPNRSSETTGHGNVGFNQVNLEEYLSKNSKADLESVINHCRSLPIDKQIDFEVDLPRNSNIILDINKALNSKFKVLLNRFLKSPSDTRSFYALGQFKYHSCLSPKNSNVWHVDGDPRYIKLLVYLTDDKTNDGAFKITHWSSLYEDYAQCTFSDISLMVSLDEKISLLRKIQQAPFILRHALISDKPYGPLATSDFKLSNHCFDVIKYMGIIFQGTTCLHSGGGNFTYDRPVLQLMIGCLN